MLNCFGCISKTRITEAARTPCIHVCLQFRGCPHHEIVESSEVGRKGHPCNTLSALEINDCDIATTSHAKV